MVKSLSSFNCRKTDQEVNQVTEIYDNFADNLPEDEIVRGEYAGHVYCEIKDPPTTITSTDATTNPGAADDQQRGFMLSTCAAYKPSTVSIGDTEEAQPPPGLYKNIAL